MTKNQKFCLENYWKLFGIEYQKSFLNFIFLFNRKTETILEIGFGMGNSLVNTAIHNPTKNFIGIEIYTPRSRFLFRKNSFFKN